MLDIRKIKENPDAVKAGLKAKEVDCDATIDRILDLEAKIRGLKTATETKTAEKNKLSKENGKLFGQKKGAEKRGEDVSALNAQIAANSEKSMALDAAIADDAALLKTLNEEFRVAMLSLPNLPDPDLLPGGKENNQPLRYFGEPHQFDFEPKHHVDLCCGLGLGGGLQGADLHVQFQNAVNDGVAVHFLGLQTGLDGFGIFLDLFDV